MTHEIKTMPPFPDAPPSSHVRREVRIHQQHGHAALFVDDVDIANTVLEADIRLGHGPAEITLRMMPSVFTYGGDQAVIKIDADTYAALLKLGWTPPAEGTAP